MLRALKWIGIGIAGILYALAAGFLLFGPGELPWQVQAGMLALPLGLAGRFFFYHQWAAEARQRSGNSQYQGPDFDLPFEDTDRRRNIG
jgi:hypothetical protein